MKISKEDIIMMLSEETGATDISEDMSLREDIGITSFEILSFTTRLSESSGISFELSDVMQWRTVGDILKTMEIKNQ